MIDPARKLARLQEERAKPKRIKRRARKRKPVSQVEKLFVAELVNDAPLNLPSAQEIADVSVALRRTPGTIKSIVVEAREQLQANAAHYVAMHKAAVDQALASNEVDVARKGSEWAIEHISSRDADGKVERIVERTEVESTSPRISIGIALGGLRK